MWITLIAWSLFMLGIGMNMRAGGMIGHSCSSEDRNVLRRNSKIGLALILLAFIIVNVQALG